MSGYIGSKASVTQVDGYNRTEADDRYVNASGDTMTGALNGRSFITADDTNNYALMAGRYSAGYGGAVINTTSNASFLELQVNGFGGLRADSAGRVTMPYQPSFHAYADIYNTSQTGGVAFSSSAQSYALNHNTGNHWNGSTGRFTAPVSGRYEFHGSYSRSQSNGGIYMEVNGNNMGGWNLSYGADWQTVSMSRSFYLNAGDYVRLIYGSVGPSYTCQGYKVMFSGYLIG